MKMTGKFIGKISLLVAVVTVLGLAIGCGNKKSAKTETKTVRLVYVNWAEGIAMTNLAKVIIEDKLGYQVKTQVADVGPVYTSIAKGDNDAFLDGWLPVTHASYMEKYGAQIDDYGTDYDGARIGLVVPTYVTIDSITQMNAVKDKFNSQIIGIDAGAGIMKATDSAIKAYDLDFELVASSGPAMTAALKKAIDKNEWIAVTGWKPHWMFARWDLKFLDDPKGVYGSVENIHVLARKGLEKDMPKVAAFLKAFHMDDQTLGDLMGKIANAKEADPTAVATTWMNNHPDLVNSWLK